MFLRQYYIPTNIYKSYNHSVNLTCKIHNGCLSVFEYLYKITNMYVILNIKNNK